MRNMGSEAYSIYGNAYEGTAGGRTREEQRHAPFGVFEGGGLDARVRQGVSELFWSRFKAVVALALLFALVGAGRVALSAATVTNLQTASGLEETISSVQTANDDLKMERSVLSSSSRINTIATQVYGMIFSSEAQDSSSEADSAASDSATAPSDASTSKQSEGSEDPQANASMSSANDAQSAGEAGTDGPLA